MEELLMSTFQIGFVYIFFSLFFSFLFWLIIRPLVLWYFKINKTVNTLTEIRDLLSEQKQPFLKNKSGSPSPEISKPKKTLKDSRWQPPEAE